MNLTREIPPRLLRSDTETWRGTVLNKAVAVTKSNGNECQHKCLTAACPLCVEGKLYQIFLTDLHICLQLLLWNLINC